jgi:hypothetical protein
VFLTALHCRFLSTFHVTSGCIRSVDLVEKGW